MNKLAQDLGARAYYHLALKDVTPEQQMQIKTLWPHILQASGNDTNAALRLAGLLGAESSYRPNVITGSVNYAGARGIAQFMPATAREYGLQISPGIDERTNAVKAIHAASKYLNYLDRQVAKKHPNAPAHYLDQVALQSYNAGLNRVNNKYLYDKGKPLTEETLKYPGRVKDWKTRVRALFKMPGS